MLRRKFLSTAAAFPLLPLWGRSAPEPIDSLELRVFAGINVQRAAADCDPLIWDEALRMTARQHSRRILDAGFFGHDDPRFGDLPTRLGRAGVRYLRCGENVFRERDFLDPAATAVVQWMYSEGHRHNILTPDFCVSGVGAARGDDGTYVITQQFIDPLNVPEFTRVRPRTFLTH